MIAGGVGEVLFETNIFFGGLNRGVAQGDLDLFEGGVAPVGEFGEGAAEVVGRDGRTEPAAAAVDHVVDGLGAHSLPGDVVALVHRPKQRSTGEA